MGYLITIIPALLPLLFSFLFLTRNSHFFPWNWPFFKLIHTAYFKSHLVYNKLTQILAENNGTILLRTSVLNRVDTLITSDPVNIQHILNSKFSIYPRGSEFQRTFDFLGEAVYIKELDVWKQDKKLINGFYKEPHFHSSIPMIIRHTLQNGLYPVLCDLSNQNQVVDLQVLFNRHMLDSTCLLASGVDLGSVRPGFPKCSLLDAMDDIGEAVFWRTVLPEKIWRLQRWFGFGKEKKMKNACTVFTQTLDNLITLSFTNNNANVFNVLKYYGSVVDREALKANLMTLLFAGRDTSGAILTWFFYLISKNPNSKSKILEEIKSFDSPKGHLFFDLDELKKMVYLHCALYESLRLFPPVASVIRDLTQGDVLPSGHRIESKTKIMLCAYATARMPEIWGDDCEDFKPERWMSEKGEVKHVASNKFLGFGSGPWACPGKEMALLRMKAVTATMLHNFDIDVMEGQSISPNVSALLNLKDGLKAKVSCKW